MGRKSKERMDELEALLAKEHIPLSGEIGEKLKVIRRACGIIGDLYNEEMIKCKALEQENEELSKRLNALRGEKKTLRRENKRLSARFEGLRQIYNKLFADHQELEEKYPRLQEEIKELKGTLVSVLTEKAALEEKRAALEIEKSVLEGRIEKLSGIIREGVDEYLKRDEEHEREREELRKKVEGLIYQFHVAVTQRDLCLPPEPEVGKLVIIGNGRFELEEGIKVSVSKYVIKVLEPDTVLVDIEKYGNAQEIIQQTLEEGGFVFDIGPNGPSYPVGADNDHYILVDEMSPGAVFKALEELVETKRQEVYAQE